MEKRLLIGGGNAQSTTYRISCQRRKERKPNKPMRSMCTRGRNRTEPTVERQPFVFPAPPPTWLCQGERPLQVNRSQTKIDAKDRVLCCEWRKPISLELQNCINELNIYLGNLVAVVPVKLTKWTRRRADSLVRRTMSSSMVCGRAWFSGSSLLK